MAAASHSAIDAAPALDGHAEFESVPLMTSEYDVVGNAAVATRHPKSSETVSRCSAATPKITVANMKLHDQGNDDLDLVDVMLESEF
eukprot:m.157328 g.157328  ORF g.157328 m.157328 type:complete len:87 (-) comp31051_c0_seq1:64-324(-)